MRRSIQLAATPRLVDEYIPHVPHPTQQLFLLQMGREAFYGGAAGGGKSDALLMAALQFVDVPDYSALILRRRYTDLALPGAIMDRAFHWLVGTSAQPINGGKSWKFPSGARLVFGYVQYPRDVEQYRSAEFQFIGIDELTQWQEDLYSFLFSRIRRPTHPFADRGDGLCRFREWGGAQCAAGPEHDRHSNPPILAPSERDGVTTLAHVPLRMRGASNPGSLGHVWVRKRLVEPETRRENTVFIPATLDDNPSLDRESYAESLSFLGPTERARLLRGDWTVVDEGVFRRTWFEIVAEAPAAAQWCRYWDLGSSDEPGSDLSAGALLGLHEGVWYLLDMQAVLATPLQVERLVRQTADVDAARGIGVVLTAMEQESGSSGVNTIHHYRRVLAGHDFRGDRPTGPKRERARPWAAAAEAGNFKLVGPAAWIEDFLDEVELFDHGEHDDRVDAVSGAVKMLGGGRGTARLIA